MFTLTNVPITSVATGVLVPVKVTQNVRHFVQVLALNLVNCFGIVLGWPFHAPTLVRITAQSKIHK